jgi:DNA topoisomerase IA
MVKWYERESGPRVMESVIERVYYETKGQPGFVSWLGELLTETYNEHKPTITSRDFEFAYSAAVATLPNANIQKIISKAKQEPYQ